MVSSVDVRSGQVGDPLKPLGYTFEAVMTSTGVRHLRWPANRYGGALLCGHATTQPLLRVDAKLWYGVMGRRCSMCEAKVGPWATVRL